MVTSSEKKNHFQSVHILGIIISIIFSQRKFFKCVFFFKKKHILSFSSNFLWKFNKKNLEYHSVNVSGNGEFLKFLKSNVLILGMRDCINFIKSTGIDIKMVTGDSKETALGISQKLGISQ